MSKLFTRLRIALIKNADKRTKYIVKHHIFKDVGDNFFFQPRIIPADSELIKFHNNVTVASNVTFVNHDIIDRVLNNLNEGSFDFIRGCIEVMDNVFIGTGTTILPNVKIGSNVIIAAGSVITKDVEDNSIMAGVPAKKIGSFDDFVKKRRNFKYLDDDALWEKFHKEKGLK